MPPAAIGQWLYFTVTIAAGLVGFFVAAVLGMVTCIGGGVARDLPTLEIPIVLRAELHAVAALASAGSIALGFVLGLPSVLMMVFGPASVSSFG